MLVIKICIQNKLLKFKKLFIQIKDSRFKYIITKATLFCRIKFLIIVTLILDK